MAIKIIKNRYIKQPNGGQKYEVKKLLDMEKNVNFRNKWAV